MRRNFSIKCIIILFFQVHVKAKSGNVGNDEARKLAKVGAKKYEADA